MAKTMKTTNRKPQQLDWYREGRTWRAASPYHDDGAPLPYVLKPYGRLWRPTFEGSSLLPEQTVAVPLIAAQMYCHCHADEAVPVVKQRVVTAKGWTIVDKSGHLMYFDVGAPFLGKRRSELSRYVRRELGDRAVRATLTATLPARPAKKGRQK